MSVSSCRYCKFVSCDRMPAYGILCLPAIRMMFVKIRLAVCMLVGIVVWANADCVFRKLCPVGFLLDFKSLSDFLYYVVMSYVECGNDG